MTKAVISINIKVLNSPMKGKRLVDSVFKNHYLMLLYLNIKNLVYCHVTLNTPDLGPFSRCKPERVPQPLPVTRENTLPRLHRTPSSQRFYEDTVFLWHFEIWAGGRAQSFDRLRPHRQQSHSLCRPLWEHHSSHPRLERRRYGGPPFRYAIF